MFDQSIDNINESFNKFKTDINKLIFEEIISKTNNNHLKQRKYSYSFTRVNNLNKAARLKTYLLSASTTNEKQVTLKKEIHMLPPKFPPVYTGQELLENKKLIKLKPILNQVKSELNTNHLPIVTLTWDVIKLLDGL